MASREQGDTDTFEIDLTELKRPQGADTIPPPIQSAGRLVGLTGVHAGRVFVIGAAPFVIGRGADAHLRIDAADVSKAHANLHRHNDQMVIADLESRNGTLVNGRIIQSETLRSGDRIQVGSTLFIYSEQDDLESRAQRLERLDALAQLAGTIAHDVRNMVAVIFANADYLVETAQHRYPEDPDLVAGLADIRGAAGSMIDLAQRLLYFGRRDVGDRTARVDVAAVVHQVIGLVRRSYGASMIETDVDLEPRLEVQGNASELVHAFLNLVLNARDAMPHGGALEIRGHAIEMSRSEALHTHLPAEGRYAEIVVRDDGVGMDPKTLARAFEPFFTTKPAGEGTGLGLASVHGIVLNHGGNITVASRLGVGTTFRLLLPLAAGDARKESSR